MPDHRRAHRALRFHDLMPYRVVEVLLVSSPYDAFILEQDGQLTEQVFHRYSVLHLPAAPRFTHVPSGEAAAELLEQRHFDLVMTMTSLAGMDVNAFGRRVKALRPGRPVVLLALDRRELHELKGTIDGQAIDGAFLWTGDAGILLAIIQHIEDRQNVDHDIAHGDVRVIILIEDSPYDYSSFLALLYRELMRQSRALYSEGVNEILRQMYMSSRPKILLATSYEDGVALLERYRKNLLAVISDVHVPRGGSLDELAGLDFARLARRSDPDLPVLLQSAEAGYVEAAAELGAVFVDKGSPSLLAEIRQFLTRSLGFGDFVFRDACGREEGRAADLWELEEQLGRVSPESIAYHASHNHFSIWLMARSELEVAARIRPQKLSDFSDIEAVRRFLVDALHTASAETHRGVVADFSRRSFRHEPFARLGRGSLGGKARGMAFLNMRLAQMAPEELGGMAVRLPQTVVVATDHFDSFVDDNGLRPLAYEPASDLEIRRRFLGGRLSGQLESDLAFVVHRLEGPLAVRSSSLLEDSMHQPLAGIYSTLMLPNNSPDPHERLHLAAAALKLVYASTFQSDARAYLAGTGNRVEEEKMGVIVQELVGRRYGRRYYPCFSGVAQSYNFYPIAPQQAADGIVHLALGLGRLVVDGGEALRFSPKHPGVLPQFYKAKSLLDRSQREFYALDMEHSWEDTGIGLLSTVRRYRLEVAEKDGSLAPVGSVFRPGEKRLRDDLSLPGPRVVTFNNILQHKAIPLPEVIGKLLALGEEGLGCPVEIEFACDMGDWGFPGRRGERRIEPTFYPLQIRPFAGHGRAFERVRVRFRREDTLCSSQQSLGNGLVEGIRDVVYVRPERWDAARNRAIAGEIGTVNRELAAEDRRYLLIGPGRWGSADEWLGIPVQWAQISNVQAIVEASPAGHDVEPSQGAHFFHNITSLQIGYLHLPPGADADAEDLLDWRWLAAQPAHRETEHLRWLRLDEPLTVALDGRRGEGVIAKPGARRL